MDVHTSQDGMVRSCTVGFRQSRAPTKWKKERSVWQVLQRSVQRLTLLLPVEEQDERLEVTDGVVSCAQRGSNSHGHLTNPVHNPAIPACELRTAKCETGENNLDDCSEAQDDGDQAQDDGNQDDGDNPPDDSDGFADSKDSGIDSEI